MLKLYQFPKPKKFPNFSPFCVKLETYLKIAGIPYEPKYTINLKKNPKKKMPYIELDGEIIGDSTIIVNKLIQLHGDKVDAWLTNEQRILSGAFQRLLENHLTELLIYFRGIYPPGRQQFFTIVFSRSSFMRKMIGKYIYTKKLNRRMQYSPVTAGFSIEELLIRAKHDFYTLSQYLADKPFIFGAQPCSVDAMLLGVYGGIICIDIETPLKDLATQYPNLREHSLRLLAKYYNS